MAKAAGRAGVALDFDAAFADALAGRRVTVRRGRQSVGVVPQEDLRRLEELDRLEDEALGRLGQAELAEFRASGESAVPWEQVKARLGL